MSRESRHFKGRKNKNLSIKTTHKDKATTVQAGGQKSVSFIQNMLSNIYFLVTIIATLTGYTIIKLFPDAELVLLNPKDQNNLVIELTNNSFITMKRIEPKFYIDRIVTLEGDSIKRLEMNNDNNARLALSYNQSYAFNYDLNTMLFDYDHPPQLFEANIAVVLVYKFWLFDREDVFFFKCKPDYHGNYLWVKEPDQDFVSEMKKDTIKPNIFDIPAMRKFKNFKNDETQKNIPLPPKSILD